MDGFEWDEGDVEKMYSLKECLGEGTYGTVWTAVETSSSEICAVKIQSFEDDEDLEYLRLEIELMRRSASPYMVQFKGCFKPENKDEEVWIVMEHCLAGSLADLMNVCETTFNEEQIQQIAAATCLGLAKLHDCNIIHRDIKAGNILLNEKGNIRITDLGVGADLKTKDERRNTLIGAPYWMAPEIMLEKGYDNRVDVWSLGITVIELADSVPPNAGVQGEDNILKLIPTQEPPTVRKPANFSDDMNSFIKACVTRPYVQRAHAADMLTHPFIAAVVKTLEANQGRSELLRALVEKEKSRILQYRNADEKLFSKGEARPPIASDKSELVSRFSRMYDDQLMTREEQIRTSVLLPTQQGLHGEKVISKEAQQLLTQNDLDFMLGSRELRESIKSGVITPHLAKLLKERREQGEEGEKDSLFDDEEEDEDEEFNDEDTAKRALESQQLHNKLIYYYSKHEPAKLRDSQALDRLVEIGMQYGIGVINDGLVQKYGEPLPAELPAQTKRREAKEAAAKKELQQKTAAKAKSASPKPQTSKPKPTPVPVEPRKPEVSKKKKQTPAHLQEIPIPKLAGTGYVRSSEKTESVRVMKDFKNVKSQFEKKGGPARNPVVNRNAGLWEMNVHGGQPRQQYKRPTSRFIKPFYKRQPSTPGSPPKAGSSQQKYSKWQITPMGYQNQKGNRSKAPAGTKSRPKNFNEVQSWWERRNQAVAAQSQQHSKVKKHTGRGDIKKLL